MSLLHAFFGDATANPFLENLHILPIFLDIALCICAFNFLCFLYRVLKGPALADRAVAMDSCGVTVMSLIVIYSIRQGTNLYMSCALVIAILGFIGMVALSKYIQSGNIVDTANIVLNIAEAEDIKKTGDVDELQKKAEEAKAKTAKNQINIMNKQQSKHKHNRKKK
jgi:multisubunit Na+/H+ antiporter MnhF subunit